MVSAVFECYVLICNWTLQSSRLFFTQRFDLEAGFQDQCMFDYLTIHEGSLEVPHIAKACGNDYPDEIVATLFVPLFVTFHSDGSTGGAGFEMTYIRDTRSGELCK